MTHLIDVAHWYLGVEHPLTAAMSSGGKFFSEDARETPDVIHTVLTYLNKLVVTFQVNQHNAAGQGHRVLRQGDAVRGPASCTSSPSRAPDQAGQDHHDGDKPRGHYDTRRDQDTAFLRTWVERCQTARRW